MRGSDASVGSLFSYIDLEERAPQDHPLRVIRRIADEVQGHGPRADQNYSYQAARSVTHPEPGHCRA